MGGEDWEQRWTWVFIVNEVKWSESHSVMSDSLRPHGLYSPWISPGQNTGVASLSLLQGIFPTQGSNPGLPHGRQILYHLSPKGSPLGAAFDPRVPWHTLELLSLESPTDTTGGRTQAFWRACQDVRQRKKREEWCSKAVSKHQKWSQTLYTALKWFRDFMHSVKRLSGFLVNI